MTPLPVLTDAVLADAVAILSLGGDVEVEFIPFHPDPEWACPLTTTITWLVERRDRSAGGDA